MYAGERPHSRMSPQINTTSTMSAAGQMCSNHSGPIQISITTEAYPFSTSSPGPSVGAVFMKSG